MTDLSHDAFQVQPEGYHSAEDARRMQQLARAMLADRRPLALSSPDPETLAHYARLLVRDLRQDPRVKVLPHLPSTTDLLLAHVNQLVADLPVDAVVDRSQSAQRPAQVLVVHDTPQLTADALALLVRLVADLPGANLRLVLVQGRDLAVSGNLKGLGPNMLHWNILPPGVTAAEAALAERSRQALRDALQDARRDAPGRDAGLGLQSAPAPSWVKRPAPALAAKTRAEAGAAPRASGRTTGRPNAPAANPTHAAARRNWVMLTGGLVLSAALAVALGLWISTHTPGPRQMAGTHTATPAR